MDNVLGSSNGNMQAPPPPPLPAGMSVSSDSGTKAAPPPPPLPAGMSVAGGSAPKAAPAPPPLPAGLNAGTAPKAAPAPPPLPAGLSAGTVPKAAPAPPPIPTPAPAPAPAPNKGLTGGSGRTSMSLADAQNEKEKEEEEARIEAAKPKVNANGGELKEGDKCFARSNMDGLYYFATIDSISSDKAKVKFFDDVEATLLESKIYTVSEAADKMQCFANYSGRGNYFPAVIESRTDDSVSVHYDENPSIKETLEYANVRFAIR